MVPKALLSADPIYSSVVGRLETISHLGISGTILRPQAAQGRTAPKCDQQKGFHHYCAIDPRLSPCVY